ncbi:MAG: hypothetical protein QMC81_05855 [Thermoanaerobacterales bacterium]|nr:hypothetical protein [Bacillota bacterium]MDI6906998.1 hypothetical protein [Thermoanaerobacterales bacterium]
MNYKLFQLKNGRVVLRGGGGGVAEPIDGVISLSSGGAEASSGLEKPYVVTYGQVYDPDIKTVKITYVNGETREAEVTDGCYLVIYDGSWKGVKKLEALGSNSEVVFTMP